MIELFREARALQQYVEQRGWGYCFIGGVAMRICSAEDLLVLKAFADRLQDRADVAGIAWRYGRGLDWDAILSRLAPLPKSKRTPRSWRRCGRCGRNSAASAFPAPPALVVKETGEINPRPADHDCVPSSTRHALLGPES
ncbi:MAG TPA: hypothetical protein VJL31_09390 [Gemmatimonadales bacterium]|nr:hypothetical protein [Gemmatimonadales bacterium]